MKRKISLVFLSLVLAFSTLFSLAFAITASADTTLVATFEFGDNGSASHADGSLISSGKSYTSGNYTLTLNDVVNVYDGAFDAKGNSCLKLGTSKKVGSFSFTVPSDVVSVVINVAKYKATSTNVTINGGTAQSISTSSNDGEYTPITVDTSSSKSVAFSVPSFRCMINSIEFYVEAAAPEVPDCTHEETTVTTVPATCTKAGKTVETCNECNAVISTEELPLVDHEFVDGKCSSCGMFDAASVDFSGRYYIATKRSSGNYFYLSNVITGSSTKRLTAVDSGLATLPSSIAASDVESTLVFVIVKNSDNTYFIYAEGLTSNNYIGYTSGNSATLVDESNALNLSIVPSSTDAALVNICSAKDSTRLLSLNSSTGTNYFAFYAGTQTQDLSLVPVEAAGDPECQHEKTEEVIVDATCQAAGSKTIKCADCGAIRSTETIEKLDSCAYGDDGICTMCGAPDPTNEGAILKALYALESGATLPGTYTLTGVIIEISESYSTEYNNVTVVIVVEGYENMPVKCYRLAGEGVDQIAVGDTITVTGSLTNYKNETYEFKQGCTLDSWVDNTTEPVPPTETDIAGVQAGEIGVTYKVVGATVVAVNAQSFLAKDESGYILVYLGSEWTADVKVGDVVTLEGASGAYANSVQFAKGTTYTVTGSAEYQAPAAEVIDGAKIDEIAGAASITPDAYVTLSGTLNISGNYYNVVVDGTNVIVSITYPTADQAAALAALNGKKVEFTGYVTGYKSYLNLLATSFEEIVPEVETKIAGTSLNVGNDLTFLYFVSLANGEDINRYSIKVEMNGKSYELSFSDMINGYYVFAFEGIAPQCMGDSIDAYLIKKGGEVVSSRTGYSVKAYLTDLVNDENNKDNSALLTLAADILAYGAAAQKYVGYNSDNLVNAGFPVAGSELDPAEAIDRKVITKNDHENTYVSGLGVRFDYVNSIFVKVVAPSIEGVTLKINGQEVELVAYGNGYIGYSAGVSALKFDGDIQVELSLNGELVSIIEYSVNSYILTKYAGESVMAELATALYRYGASAVAYNNSLAN